MGNGTRFQARKSRIFRPANAQNRFGGAFVLMSMHEPRFVDRHLQNREAGTKR
jgi:hypothetical protein